MQDCIIHFIKRSMHVVIGVSFVRLQVQHPNATPSKCLGHQTTILKSLEYSRGKKSSKELAMASFYNIICTSHLQFRDLNW
jgi:hypothetical protein